MATPGTSRNLETSYRTLETSRQLGIPHEAPEAFRALETAHGTPGTSRTLEIPYKTLETSRQLEIFHEAPEAFRELETTNGTSETFRETLDETPDTNSQLKTSFTHITFQNAAKVRVVKQELKMITFKPKNCLNKGAEDVKPSTSAELDHEDAYSVVEIYVPSTMNKLAEEAVTLTDDDRVTDDDLSINDHQSMYTTSSSNLNNEISEPEEVILAECCKNYFVSMWLNDENNLWTTGYYDVSHDLSSPCDKLSEVVENGDEEMTNSGNSSQELEITQRPLKRSRSSTDETGTTLSGIYHHFNC